MDRNRVVLASMAALVAAMLGRMGWVNWPAIATTTIVIVVGLALVVAVIVVVCGPMLLLTWAAVSLVTFLTESLDVSSPQPGPHSVAPAPSGVTSPTLLTWEGV
jgi:hypothetical protein